jgi:hypothetical protein
MDEQATTEIETEALPPEPVGVEAHEVEDPPPPWYRCDRGHRQRGDGAVSATSNYDEDANGDPVVIGKSTATCIVCVLEDQGARFPTTLDPDQT